MAVVNRQSKVRGNEGIKFKKRLLSAAIFMGWRAFPELSKRIIKQQFFTPRRVPYSLHQRQYLETGQAVEVIVNGEVIKCWRWGQGPTLIFVHGWNGGGLQFRSFADAAVAHGFSAVLFDGPGHGMSGGNTCSYFQMTDAVRALLNHFRQDPVAGLVGHSFGAAAIVNCLVKEGRSLPAVLVAPALDLVGILGAAFAFHAVPQRVYQSIICDFEKQYGYTLADGNPKDLLADIKQPILLVHDTSDRVISHSATEKSVRQVAGITLISTTGLGHKQILKDPGVIQEAIRYFNGVARPGGFAHEVCSKQTPQTARVR
jgi:pimeloyl-ACP methyl ester carboxylesterase